MVLVFVALPQKISRSYKTLVSLLSLVCIAVLLYRVTDIEHLKLEEQFSPEASIELAAARADANNIVAWNDLGRAYLLQKEYVNAYMAYSESEQLDSFVGLGLNQQESLSERLKWMTGLAETRILAQGGAIDSKATELILATLQLDAKHPKALWYGGLLAAQQEDFVQAKIRWEQLLAQNPPDALRNVVQLRLNAVNELLQSSDNSQDKDWQFAFKLKVSQELLAQQTPASRVFVTLKQGAVSAPIIVKVFSLAELEDIDVITLSMNDRIVGMSERASVNWDEPVTLTVVWSPNGSALAEDNVRLEKQLKRENLSSIFEYLLQ